MTVNTRTSISEANSLVDAGRPAAALRLLLSRTGETPRDSEGWIAVGRAATAIGDLSRAGEAYQRVLETNPDHRDGLIGAGLVLQGRSLHDDAFGFWGRAHELDPSDPVPATLIGVDLLHRGDLSAAEQWLRRALARRPGHVDALAGLGVVLERDGRAAEGIELLAPLAARQAEPNGQLAAALGRCQLVVGDTGEALATVQQALSGETDRNRRIQLEHVAGDVLDELERPREAFAAYARANGLRTARFDGARHLASVRQMIAACSRGRLRAAPRGSQDGRRSILVVGMPRSGTSLTERLLASHSGIGGAGELATWRLLAGELPRIWKLPHGQPWYQRLDLLSTDLLDDMAVTYLHELKRFGEPGDLVVDKMPQNIFQVPLAALALPGTVVVHTVRDPLDVGWSCFRTQFSDGLSWSTNLEAIALYLRGERELMAHWKQVLDVPILTVRYEELTATPRAALAPVLAATGLAWDPAMLDFHRDSKPVATASYREVQEPLHRRSVGRAQRYAQELAPLQRVLAAFGELPS